MARPCVCDNYCVGEPYSKGQCRLCWLYHNDQRYRKLWDRDDPATSGSSAKPPIDPEWDWDCIHRGQPTGEKVDCRCATPEPIYQCNSPRSDVRTCIIRKTIAGRIAPNVCNKCPVREEPPEDT